MTGYVNWMFSKIDHDSFDLLMFLFEYLHAHIAKWGLKVIIFNIVSTVSLSSFYTLI